MGSCQPVIRMLFDHCTIHIIATLRAAELPASDLCDSAHAFCIDRSAITLVAHFWRVLEVMSLL
jgi:hypothetical protein